ncbi:head maturation protease, ClpP-related [Anaeromyxobacter sp. PSR-1]|uniref:head maturation protease, ClpP-related n=1 Tax=Anaeromyxobacter sp. PSR-1 TaxID=1300915 RepID=UPI0005E17D1F|nr:head maturation protease, ClpP-related [Anaeromyxobacter sp. PSR-1]GAO01932.1 ATP-dependent Clp protease proteolytic subunit 2 [Anaeromyxobacter sp. PSR-1]
MKIIQPVRLSAAEHRALKPEGLVQMKNERVQLYLYGDVGRVFGGFGSQDIADALSGKKGPLDIFISSDGGDAHEGVSIFNILARYPGHKTAYVDGLAASAASVILMAADERIMGVGSQVMVHGAWSGVMGNPAKLREAADKLELITNSIAEIYVSRTKQSPEKVDEWVKSEETWFNADEAVANGLADRVDRIQTPGAENKITEPKRLSKMDYARLNARIAQKK